MELNVCKWFRSLLSNINRYHQLFSICGNEPAGTVPITLIDFKGKYNDKKSILNWSTLTESNTRYFTVEKSIDAVSFQPLTNMTAYGNSQVKRNYNYVDDSSCKLYQLLQVKNSKC